MLTDAEKLKDFRNSLRLSQQEFAVKLGVGLSTISMIECGKNKISRFVKEAILKVYNFNIETGTQELKKEITSNIIPIPFYDVKAAANPKGELMLDYPESESLYFDKRWLKNILMVNPSNLAIIQAKGNSMDGGTSPIKDGDLLMLDESIKEPANKQIFVVRIDGLDLVVKRTDVAWDGTVKLCSNNPEYGEVVPFNNAEIIGKVVWNGSKENV